MDITDGYAQILLEGNIIVKNGGILEVCGYVTGNGQVTAEAGVESEICTLCSIGEGNQALVITIWASPFQ